MFLLAGVYSDVERPAMSFENYGWDDPKNGVHGWHLDHIVPLYKFDLTDHKQFLKANHYTNLQPLWGKCNLIKSGK